MPKTKNKPGIHLHQCHKWKTMNGKPVPEWFWNIVSKNGRIIARSSETYSSKKAAVKSIKTAATIFWDNENQYMYYDHSKPDSKLQSYL